MSLPSWLEIDVNKGNETGYCCLIVNVSGGLRLYWYDCSNIFSCCRKHLYFYCSMCRCYKIGFMCIFLLFLIPKRLSPSRKSVEIILTVKKKVSEIILLPITKSLLIGKSGISWFGLGLLLPFLCSHFLFLSPAYWLFLSLALHISFRQL